MRTPRKACLRFALGGLIPFVGEDRFFWATDYPHADHGGGYVEELKQMLASMPDGG